MQKRQANAKLPSKSLILIGSRQGTDGKSTSNSASVRGRSSSCSVTADTPSGCRLARGTRPEPFSKARKDSAPLGCWGANKLIPFAVFLTASCSSEVGRSCPQPLRSVAIYISWQTTLELKGHMSTFPQGCAHQKLRADAYAPLRETIWALEFTRREVPDGDFFLMSPSSDARQCLPSSHSGLRRA